MPYFNGTGPTGSGPGTGRGRGRCRTGMPDSYALQRIYHAVSLGATESLICIPFLTTMLYMPPERRTVFGVKENTVRLSVGIEPEELLIDDLKNALR